MRFGFGVRCYRSGVVLRLFWSAVEDTGFFDDVHANRLPSVATLVWEAGEGGKSSNRGRSNRIGWKIG